MSEAARLIETPGAPIPAGGKAEWVIGEGGARLRAALFPGQAPVRGSVVLSGGRTEPIEKYFEVIGELTARGFTVLAHDWRGQGLSHRSLPDRLKGHADGYRPFLADFRALLAAYEDRLPKPWLTVAHSMGGGLTLLALAHGQASRFAGAVLSAPMLGLNTGRFPPGVSRFLAGLNRTLGRAGGYVLGQAGNPYDDTFAGNALTHDEARFLRHRAQIRACPDLALGSPTWGWLDFAFQTSAWLARAENLKGVSTPVVICSAELERLVDNSTHAAAAKALPNGKLAPIPGALHEILMETDPIRAFFWTAFDELADQVAPRPAPAKSAATSKVPPAAKPVAEPKARGKAPTDPAPPPAKARAPRGAAKTQPMAEASAAAEKTETRPKASAKPGAAAKSLAAKSAPAAPKAAAASKSGTAKPRAVKPAAAAGPAKPKGSAKTPAPKPATTKAAAEKASRPPRKKPASPSA